jgi:hypothetical protein
MDVSCTINNGTYMFSDLGACVIHLKRFLEEDRRYSSFSNKWQDNSNQDGLLTTALIKDGWRTKHVHHDNIHSWLVDHNPNYQSCIRGSKYNIWNDREKKCVSCFVSKDDNETASASTATEDEHFRLTGNRRHRQINYSNARHLKSICQEQFQQQQKSNTNVTPVGVLFPPAKLKRCYF